MGRNKKKTNLTHFTLLAIIFLLLLLSLLSLLLLLFVIDVVWCVVVVVVVFIIVVVFLLLLFTVCYDTNYIKGENGKHITIATAIEIVVSVSSRSPQLCDLFSYNNYKCTRRGIEREWNCMV